PSEMRVLSRISGSDLMADRDAGYAIVGLFLYERTLAIITSLHPSDYGFSAGTVVEGAGVGGWTLVSLYSTRDPESPTPLHEFELTGAYRASRMKGATVYLVLHQYLVVGEDETSYPVICEDGLCQEYDAARIYYDPEVEESGSLTNVVALDLLDGETGYLSVLTGFVSTVYMSPANLYVTFGKWRRAGVFMPGEGDTLTTSIYRIAVEGTQLHPAAGGDVKGWLLNQFSLDEQDAHLRVATTTWGDVPQNHVYVLDEALEVVGALEGLAPGETIYSARFLGDLGYLVTFEKVDPFFVLDLADPRRPRVLGYLKIPGFSEYLHPLDETHILGVGKDTIEDPGGAFSWFQGLKLSLFDVSDVGDPKEVAKLLLGDRGSSSPVLYDHRAFLYIREARLVVLPVDLVELVEPPTGDGELPPWEYGTEPWHGALVLTVTPETGFEVQAWISHLPLEDQACRYAGGPYGVTRALYIGEYLYTVSPRVLQAHSLLDFSEAGSLVYDEAPGHGWC
ncbi:MAG: beta-propeller domain-containing protein, partial [Thermoplasmata archaeon]